MRTQIWVDGKITRPLTDKQAKKMRIWLEKFEPDSDFDARGASFYLGWIGWDDLQHLKDQLLKYLPKGASAELDIEYTECDDPGKDYEWIGPEAEELELKHVDCETEKLVRRRNEVLAKLFERNLEKTE